MTDDAPETDASETPAAPVPDPFPNDTLPAALARYSIELPVAQVALLDKYCRALWEMNEKLNLTRHTTYEKFVGRDLVDVRALLPYIGPKDRVVDVGTGGGVPGIVLKILRPDVTLTLTDSVQKKARAVDEISKQIGLTATVHAGRAEEVLLAHPVDVLVVRAVAPLAKLVTWFTPLMDRFRTMLVIKGPSWVDERHEARQKKLMYAWDLRKLDEWPLPGTHSNSVLLELKRRENA